LKQEDFPGGVFSYPQFGQAAIAIDPPKAFSALPDDGRKGSGL